MKKLEKRGNLYYFLEGYEGLHMLSSIAMTLTSEEGGRLDGPLGLSVNSDLRGFMTTNFASF